VRVDDNNERPYTSLKRSDPCLLRSPTEDYAGVTTDKPSIPKKSLSRLTGVAPNASAVAATQRSFSSSTRTVPLTSEFDAGVEIACSLRDWFAMKS
jgi:hypothetical protein